MTRLDRHCAMDTAKTIVDMVAHLLREEEKREFFSEICRAIEACLAKRDEMLRHERKRLGKRRRS